MGNVKESVIIERRPLVDPATLTDTVVYTVRIPLIDGESFVGFTEKSWRRQPDGSENVELYFDTCKSAQ